MKHKQHKLIFAIVYLAYTSIYIARVNLSMAGPDLIDIGVLNTVQLGSLGSIFSTFYAVGRLLNGGLSDKTPPWIMLTTGLALAGISNICIGFFPPFIGIFLFWMVNAYAQSMLWSSVLCVIAAMYEQKIAKRKTSVMVTSVATGNILAIISSTALIEKFGVRFAFIIPGALTILLGALVMISTRKISLPPVQEKKHLSMFSMLKNKELLTMSLPAMFHGVMKENISLWMAVYVVNTYQVDLKASSYYILLIPVIGFIGRVLYTPTYRLCREKENTVSLVGFAGCVICSILLCTGKLNMIGSVLCLSLIYAAVSIINTSMLSIYPMHYIKTGNVASVSGIMDFATYLGGGIASMIYGIVISHWGYLPMFISWLLISVFSMLLIQKINQDRKVSVVTAEEA